MGDKFPAPPGAVGSGTAPTASGFWGAESIGAGGAATVSQRHMWKQGGHLMGGTSGTVCDGRKLKSPFFWAKALVGRAWLRGPAPALILPKKCSF